MNAALSEPQELIDATEGASVALIKELLGMVLLLAAGQSDSGSLPRRFEEERWCMQSC